MSTEHEYLAPVIAPETKPFWEAANEGWLAMQVCNACGRGHHYPRAVCPHCHSQDLKWTRTDGLGHIYSFTVVQVPRSQPYVLAFVEIAPQVRAMTNIVDCDPASLAIGQAVRAVFRPAAGGQNILLFTPEKAAAGDNT